MQQEEALQHTAWQRFALYTTAMYRGCLWEQPRLKGVFFVITFLRELFMGEAAEMALDQPYEGAPGWVRWSDRAI